MRGEDRGETGAFRQCLVFRPADRAVVRVGTQQMLRQTGEDGVIRRGVDAAEIVGDAVGPVGESGVAQIAGSGRRCRLRSTSPVSNRRVIASDTSKTGLPNGSSLRGRRGARSGPAVPGPGRRLRGAAGTSGIATL